MPEIGSSRITKRQILFVAISTFIAVIFIVFPQIDLYVSGLFFRERFNVISDTPLKFGFFLNKHPVFVFLHDSVRYVTITIALVLFGMLALHFIKKRNFFGLSKKHLAYLILCLAIGPGLVVNAIFKDNWGRARPYQTENFGGNKKFTPPFIISDQCDRNCSFTSGDPSVGFFFFAFAFAIQKKRKEFSAIAMTLGIMWGATRVVQGAHFFSDVIFSGIFVFGVCYLLHKIMFRNKHNST